MPFVEDKGKPTFSENSEALLEHPVHTKLEYDLCDVWKEILKLSYSEVREQRVEEDNKKQRKEEAKLAAL